MNFEEQINIVRREKHEAYLKYLLENEEKTNEIKTNIFMEHLAKKYKHFFNPSAEEKSVRMIQKFIKKKLFSPCINDNEITHIPPIYRIRISITNQHLKEYSENNINDSTINMYRLMYKMLQPKEKFVLFRYCFDIRKLFPMRNQIIELCDNFYFMQPDDHERIISCWKKVNGETRESINYLNDFNFYKSLSIDKFKPKNHIQGESIGEQKQNEKICNMDIGTLIDYFDELNRQYINS